METAGDEQKTSITLTLYFRDQIVDLESIDRCMGYIEDLHPDARVRPVLEKRSKNLYLCWTSFLAMHYQVHQIANNEEIKT